MQYRRLGRAGLQLSALSLGSWVTFGDQVDQRTAQACMGAAYDAGINFFDNAEAYAGGRSEEVMGRLLATFGWPRDTFVLSSKVFWGGDRPNQSGLCRKHVIEACHAALRRLRVEYLDLYFCHRPDPATPIEETVRAMDLLVRQGKVLYWGTSEWPAEDIRCAWELARELALTPPTMEQPQYNMLHRHRVETEYRELYADIGLGTTVWSPLASGVLTGKYRQGVRPGSRADLPGFDWLRERIDAFGDSGGSRLLASLETLAESLGASLAQLCIAWCLKNPHVSTVLLGASRREQLEDNLGSLAILDQLDEALMARIDGWLGTYALTGQ
jgi:voltage-dependent potassium channel beta subunit